MSTTLPHGIIQINEGNIAWYGDITANWQLIDSKIGEYDAAVASIPAPANNGTLTINYGDTTIAMFGADDEQSTSRHRETARSQFSLTAPTCRPSPLTSPATLRLTS